MFKISIEFAIILLVKEVIVLSCYITKNVVKWGKRDYKFKTKETRMLFYLR